MYVVQRYRCSTLLTAAMDSRTKKAGLFHSEHSVSIPVVKVEEDLYELDVFLLRYLGGGTLYQISINP